MTLYNIMHCNFYGKGSDSESGIKLTSYCSTCQGNYTLIYECDHEVMGHQFDITLWSGSAFDCARMGNEISLLHNLYTDNSISARAYGDCNNDSIVAQSLRVKNHTYYTSQLNVTVSDSVVRTIYIIYIHTYIHTYIYNSRTATSPNISEMADLESREITLSRTEVAPECPAIEYNIQASNCGSCPTTTNHTNVTCTEVPTNSGMCMFTIKIVICGYEVQKSKLIVPLDYRGIAI
jgi:hypothetical protein